MTFETQEPQRSTPTVAAGEAGQGCVGETAPQVVDLTAYVEQHPALDYVRAEEYARFAFGETVKAGAALDAKAEKTFTFALAASGATIALAALFKNLDAPLVLVISIAPSLLAFIVASICAIRAHWCRKHEDWPEADLVAWGLIYTALQQPDHVKARAAGRMCQRLREAQDAERKILAQKGDWLRRAQWAQVLATAFLAAPMVALIYLAYGL